MGNLYSWGKGSEERGFWGRICLGVEEWGGGEERGGGEKRWSGEERGWGGVGVGIGKEGVWKALREEEWRGVYGNFWRVLEARKEDKAFLRDFGKDSSCMCSYNLDA